MTTVGVVCEVKAGERRCGLTPAGARELTSAGHRVLVERGAGAGSGLPDDAYAPVVVDVAIEVADALLASAA